MWRGEGMKWGQLHYLPPLVTNAITHHAIFWFSSSTYNETQHELELFMFACLPHPSKWRWPARRCRSRLLYPQRCRWRDSLHPGRHGEQKGDYYRSITDEWRKSGSWIGCWLQKMALFKLVSILAMSRGSCCLHSGTGEHTPTHTCTRVHLGTTSSRTSHLWWLSPHKPLFFFSHYKTQ